MPTKFYYFLGEFPDGFARDICCKDTQREMTGRTDKYLIGLSSKTYVFEDGLTRCRSD